MKLFLLSLILLTTASAYAQGPQHRPLSLHIILNHSDDDELLSILFQEAGIPPGSKINFYYGAGVTYAPHDSIQEPNEPTLAWARSLIQ